MQGPIRFVFTIIWFAIGLGIAGTLKDCTATMARHAAIAHKHGGISYGWWNRQLVGDAQTVRNSEHRYRKKGTVQGK